MKRIGIVVPYFGKLPVYFPLWLQSCGCNPDIDFLFFTDDRTAFDWPENVRVVYMSWQKMQERIRRSFDFPVQILRTYKLCDYRPAFGEIFSRELEGYDFWGHCDIDVIWGALRDFLPEEALDRYDKLFYRGHFSLYRNTGRINRLYRSRVEGGFLYRSVFLSEKSMAFDEWTGINRIFDGQKIPVYDRPVVADINTDWFHFVVNGDSQARHRSQVFLWRKGEDGRGRIFRYYQDQGDLVCQEFMYIHLQKRDMAWLYGRKLPGAFLIVPNEFVPCQKAALYLTDPETEDQTAKALIRKFCRKRLVNWPLVKKKYRRRLGKLKKTVGQAAGRQKKRRQKPF